ncbi:putative disease resistance RPP13-like protein 1 [Lactuca sativa]|nr:putative disease resistance RPP13-like protein 1 [Lactuca sativa]
MAEIVVSAFFSVFFEKLASEAIQKIARAKGIDSQLRKLKRSLIQIKALLNDASQKEITDQAVKEWLNGLQHLAYDIDDLLDDLATEGMHRELTEEPGDTTSMVRKLIPTCCTNFSLSSRMGSKIDAITTKLQELVEEKENLGLSVKDESPKHMNRRLETSLVDASSIVGRKDEKDALIHKLYEPCDRNYSIVPIVGMGGVGKTTLARLLYDEMQGKAHFELNAWVCVSDEFDIFNITKVIFQAIGGGNQKFKDLNLLQVALKEKISKKRFLLVLDDVWSESYTDWEILERPFLAGAPGSKIIITTRKLSLLTQLGYNQPYSLSVLSHENAVSLFCQHAFGENNFDSHPSLKPHGEGIVKKCDGLPLALIALGRLLRTKTDEEEWKELLNSEIWRLGNRDKIIPALRLSYHDLSANLKLLFAYCSLFPKDYVFDMEELILLWMAEGFLHQSSTGKSMERMGVECFEDLLSRSFFQQAPNDKSLFVMHDLMNDLAMSVAGEFFSRLDIEMKKEIGKDDPGKYRHMSFVCERYMVYTKFEAFKGANSLRTLLALSFGMINSWQTFYLSNEVLDNLLQELPLLRVLSLSNLSIREVPEFIGSLKHLRYLNLSQTRITHLPDNVGNLYNLQTLIVYGCSYLKKLPESFSKLKNLRHFDMRDTRLLNKMPLGIGELKSLRTLSRIIIEGDSSFSISELKDLKDLQGKISFEGLDKVRNPMYAQEVNLSHRRLSELEVKWSDVFDNSREETVEQEVLNVMKPHNDNLKHLRIVSYGGTKFPNWVGDPSFYRLAKVTLTGCKKCTSLPPLGQLPLLKELGIAGMDEVKVVGPELLGTSLAFPSLEKLHIFDMKGWEAWSTNNNGVLVDTAFPCLQELLIWNCPNLVTVSVEALPSLRVLRITECGHEVLGSLVRVASSITTLVIDKISGLNDQVWGGVIEHLGAVEDIHITRCNEIRYLWKSEAEASKVLVNLSRLHVGSCSNMVSLGEKEEDNCRSNLTSLTSLEVWKCKSLEHCSCPNSLKSLDIRNCNKLLEKELAGARKKPLINSNILMLESVCIINWPNLKSITDLSSFNHLRNLQIENCPNMESFPDHELPELNVLTHLTILNCQSMDASFPIGLWPPKLLVLVIGGLKKPISKWGPQNFPTSLVYLLLVGGGSEDVSNISQLSHLLPSSLTSLYIEEFEKVESVSKGLQHLTSLQHLLIRNCPKTRDLPEMLLHSLLTLTIDGCPNLKERSSKRGSYWPLVSRIPCIRIY